MQEGWQDELETAVQGMKVTFQFCADDEEAESQKWFISSRVDVF